jgi:hypothetical protein
MPPVETHEEDTGIYRKTVETCRPGNDPADKAWLKRWGKRTLDSLDLDLHLSQLADRCAAIAKGGATGPIVKDAEEASAMVGWVRYDVQEIVKLLPKRKAGGLDPIRLLEHAVLWAYKLGRLAERIDVRPFEPMVKRVKTTTAKLCAAAAGNAHSPENIAQAIALYGRLQRQRPNAKLGVLQAEVESKTGIPPRTLRRHLPKNPGK